MELFQQISKSVQSVVNFNFKAISTSEFGLNSTPAHFPIFNYTILWDDCENNKQLPLLPLFSVRIDCLFAPLHRSARI